MTIQANRSSIDFTSIDQFKNKDGFKGYIDAIHAGFSGDYKPIEDIFRRLLEQSKPS